MSNRKTHLRLILLILLTIGFGYCFGQDKDTVVAQWKPAQMKVVKSVKGVASFYADRYNGRKTASGEIYDMNGLSAAHQTYKMGTVLCVTNLSNGNSVVVKVNDRLPKRADRILDLSFGAAKLLGMIAMGVVKVRLDVLECSTE